MNAHTKFNLAISAVIALLIAALLNLAPAYGRDQAKYDAYRARRAVRMEIRRTRRPPVDSRRSITPNVSRPQRVSMFRPMPLGMDQASWESYVRRSR